MVKLIDAHSHVQAKQFDNDRQKVISRALDRDIWVVNVGDNRKSSKDAVEIANKYGEDSPRSDNRIETGVYATIGQHPNEKEDFDYGFYRNLAKEKKVVAIGECGLDYYRMQTGTEEAQISADKRRQKELFEKQIDLAKEIGLPLMIHTREAFSETISILKNDYMVSDNPGVIHFFTGTKDIAREFLEMGFSFTFGGLITFNRGFDDAVRYIPLENILIETDAPYVTPVPHRGQRNEPAYVEEVAKAIAGIRGISFDEVAEITTQNARRIFRI